MVIDLSAFEQFNALYDQESIHRYKPGGYHPVSLGDTFKGDRYKIRHKLGWGGFSTVWLARDSIRDEWVAIKILAADATQKKLSKELEFLQGWEYDHDSSLDFVVHLLDVFQHEGPNRLHQCLVFELLGPSLDGVAMSLLENASGAAGPPEDNNPVDNRIASDVILRVSQLFLYAIACIHEAGIAHGDLSGHNVAFTASKIQHVSEQGLFEIIGTPAVNNVVRLDGQPLDPSLPRHLVRRTEWSCWIDEDEENIRLLDWGESFNQGEEPEPTKLAQPSDSMAPETIFTDRVDHRADLWRAGITIFTIIFGYRPFCGPLRHGEHFWLVRQMIGFVEDIPEEWKEAWLQLKEELPKDDDEIPDADPAALTLEKLFHDLPEDPGDPALRPLLPVIRGLMRFRPSDRLSASEALSMLMDGLDPEDRLEF